MADPSSSFTMASPAESPPSDDALTADVASDAAERPRTKTFLYYQCTPCFRYRARCGSARPCQRCIDRHTESRCQDVGPPCVPCLQAKVYCDRRRPCKRCLEPVEEGQPPRVCEDGPMDEKRAEVLEVDDNDQPLLPPPRPDPVPRPVSASKPQRRLNEGEKLLAEMEASEQKRRRTGAHSHHDDGDLDGAHNREKENRREELIKASHTHRGGLLPRPSASPPLLPPPPPSPPPLRLHVQFPDPTQGEEGWGDDDDDPLPPFDTGALIDTAAAGGDPDALPPHFLTDFNHLIPRPPMLPLSSSPVAFLNLWAHFMHVQRRPITGHHIILQQRSVTAWDVYRVVTEHGGYHRVLTRRLFHSVLSSICHSSSPLSPAVLSTTLPGGPPLTIPTLRPRTFLIDYYERFLYAFELAYQWEKGHAPGIVPQPGRSVASVVEGRRRKRKAPAGVKIDLLKRLWAPSYHSLLFKERPAEDDGVVEEEEPLGYVGMTRIKRSVGSGMVEEVSSAMNRLLRVSWRVGRRGGGWEEEEVDDDEDGSDACLLFYHDVITDLLHLLLYPPFHTSHLSAISPSPLLTPLLVHEHLQNLASSSPDFHTAALIILHNLSSHPHNHHRLAGHTTALNLLTHLIIDPDIATLHSDADESFTLALRTLMQVLCAVNARHVIRRDELVEAMIGVLQRWLEGAVWGGGGGGGEEEGDTEEEREEEAECVTAVLSGFIGLLTNPHHPTNIPYLISTLPAAFFSLLLTLTSPLTPSLSIRHLATHALTFFCLSHRTFASRVVQVRGMPTLLSFLCRGRGLVGEGGGEGGGGGESEAEKEMRRATAATVQAIVSYCVVGGGEEVRREGLQWEMVWKHEASLFAACSLDTDVSALLVPALQRSSLTRQQQQMAAEAAGA